MSAPVKRERPEVAASSDVLAVGEENAIHDNRRPTAKRRAVNQTAHGRNDDDDDALPDVKELGDMGDLFSHANPDAPIKVLCGASARVLT
jgi:hypothetical protein